MGLQYVYDVVKGGNLTLRYASSDDASPDQEGWACGFISLGAKGDGPIQPLVGRTLAYSRGHALILARGSEPFVANMTRAESPGTPVNDTLEAEGSFRGGERLVMETAYLSSDPGGATPLTGVINLTTDGTLRLNRTVPFWFRCGSNLESFRGTFAAAGLGPAVAVKDALAEHPTGTPSHAELFVVQDPRLASTCTAFLLHNGTTVAESGRQTSVRQPAYCVVVADMPPGRVGFQIKDSFMAAPILAYTLQERAPGMER
ncbi:MAG: hypothetical protein ABR586_08280 [Thermoplasmatota archaeon]